MIYREMALGYVATEINNNKTGVILRVQSPEGDCVDAVMTPLQALKLASRVTGVVCKILKEAGSRARTRRSGHPKQGKRNRRKGGLGEPAMKTKRQIIDEVARFQAELDDIMLHVKADGDNKRGVAFDASVRRAFTNGCRTALLWALAGKVK